MPAAYNTTAIDASRDNQKQIYARNVILSNLTGIEGIPYQFMDTVDMRPIIPLAKDASLSSKQSVIGRKYTEKIISRIPLLFLTPCQPKFMEGFSSSDRTNAILALTSEFSGSLDQLIGNSDTVKGRYYTTEFAYARYYTYLNFMLAAVASYLGLQNEYINGKKLGSIDWSTDTQDAFKTYFDSRENLVFYLDNLETIDESFSNSTTQSAIASQINGFSDTAKELDFLLGTEKSGAIGAIREAAEGVGETVSSALGTVASEVVGKGILSSLTSTGVNSILNGGKIMFPDMWGDSSFDKGYSITFKFRSPDNDSLSIFLNVLKPYCKLLALVLPHSFSSNPNGYRTPFLVRAYSKGLFSIDMGMITGLSAVKGAACCWNDDGLPTQIDVSIEIADLYKQLYMSGYRDDDQSVGTFSSLAVWKDVGAVKTALANNTAYMDFLANMAGLNINQMELFRRAKMFYYLMKNDINTIPSSLGTRFGQTLENAIGRNLFNF